MKMTKPLLFCPLMDESFSNNFSFRNRKKPQSDLVCDDPTVTDNILTTLMIFGRWLSVGVCVYQSSKNIHHVANGRLILFVAPFHGDCLHWHQVWYDQFPCVSVLVSLCVEKFCIRTIMPFLSPNMVNYLSSR